MVPAFPPPASNSVSWRSNPTHMQQILVTDVGRRGLPSWLPVAGMPTPESYRTEESFSKCPWMVRSQLLELASST